MKGIVVDEFDQIVVGANITYGNTGVISDFHGVYNLTIPANEDVVITFSHINFKKIEITVNLTPNEDFEFNPVLKTNVEQITEVVIRAERIDGEKGLRRFSQKTCAVWSVPMPVWRS